MKAQRLTEVITFRVGKSVLTVIDRIAKKEDRKRADIVRRIFLQAMDRLPAPPCGEQKS